VCKARKSESTFLPDVVRLAKEQRVDEDENGALVE
jgi:hypothetical protein